MIPSTSLGGKGCYLFAPEGISFIFERREKLVEPRVSCGQHREMKDEKAQSS